MLNKRCNPLGARMSFKMHFLHSHSEFFPENNGDLTMSMEKHSTWTLNSLKKGRQPSNVSPAMMVDFC